MSQWIRSFFVFLICAAILVGCAYGKYLRKGDDAFAAGDYETALRNYEAAASVDPNSEEAAEKVTLAKEKLVAGDAQTARDALAADDLLGAMVAARKAWDRLPEAAPTRQIILEVSNATFTKAQTLVLSKDFANALMLYETLAETLPSEAEKTVPHAGEVRDKWSTLLEERATTAEAAGRKGDAMLGWAKLAQLSGDPGHGGKRDALRNAILDEWAYWVQLSGKGGEAYENVVAGLSGVTRSSALRVATRVPSGTNPAAKARITLGRPKFNVEKTTRTATVQYQSGTKQVENPFYKTKQDRLLDEERRLVDKQNDVTKLESDVSRYEDSVAKEGDTPNVSTGAEQSLSNAKSRLESARRSVQDQRNAVQRAKEELAREPQTKEEPVFSDHTYTITTHTRRGQMSVVGNITHADGRPPAELRNTALVEASDDEHAAQDIAGVAADALTLTSEGQLSTQLYEQGLAKSRALVASSFSSWRAALVERAVNAASDDERVDLMVIYIVTNPATVTPKVPADLSALRGIPDSVKILSP